MTKVGLKTFVEYIESLVLEWARNRLFYAPRASTKQGRGNAKYSWMQEGL